MVLQYPCLVVQRYYRTIVPLLGTRSTTSLNVLAAMHRKITLVQHAEKTDICVLRELAASIHYEYEFLG
jgi:hypothetical protein